MVVPLELWLGIKPPSVLHVLKVWGCAAYSLELGQRGKFDAKVQKMVHLGYDVATHAGRRGDCIHPWREKGLVTPMV